MPGIFWESTTINACEETTISWGNGTAPYTVTLVSRATDRPESLFATLVQNDAAGTLRWRVPDIDFIGQTFYFKVADQLASSYSAPIFFYGGIDENGALACIASSTGTGNGTSTDTANMTQVTNVPANWTTNDNGTILGNYTGTATGTWTGPTATGSSNATDPYYPPYDPGLPSGENDRGKIAGIVVGTLAAFFLLLLGRWLVRRRRARAGATAGGTRPILIDDGDSFHDSASVSPHDITPFSTLVLSEKTLSPATSEPSPTSSRTPTFASANQNPFDEPGAAELGEKRATLARLATHNLPSSAAELAEKHATLARLATRNLPSASSPSSPSGITPISPPLHTPLSPLPAASKPTARTRRPAPPRPVAPVGVPLHDVDAGRIPELPPMYDPAWKNEGASSAV